MIEEYHLRYYRSDNLISPCLVFADMSSEMATLSNLMQTCILIGCLGFLLFLGISILLSKWAVRPVELAWQQQRQFVADASHELKTPLTVIEQMLQLARAYQADPREHFSSVDLSKVASEALLPFEPIFFEAGLTLTSDLSPAVQVTGSEPQLRQVLEILLDNARKYSQEGGATQVCLKRRGKSHCLLTVANQGEPISPEALANLFKRFYRADPARSRNGSYGLGLAIAESIVNRHRGKIWAESQNGINTFYVELPCS